MPFVTDKNGDYILDENNQKIEYTVEYIDDENLYFYNKEEILVNNDGHLVIKDAVNDNHAVSKSQLNQVKAQLQTNTTEAINALEAKLQKQITQLNDGNR